MMICQLNSQGAREMNTKANRPYAAEGKVSKVAASITRNNTKAALGFSQNGNVTITEIFQQIRTQRKEHFCNHILEGHFTQYLNEK